MKQPLSVLSEYKAVLDAVVSHNSGESKQAHKALSVAMKSSKLSNAAAPFLLYLAKVYIELGVHEVLDIEQAFQLETSQAIVGGTIH